MNGLMAGWKKLRSRYWLALSFDLACLLVVMWGIHAWQTRELPIGEAARPTRLPLLADTESPSTAPGYPSVPIAEQGSVPAIQPGSVGVVYFFAPWCGVCRHSISNLDQQVQDGSIDWATAIALDYGSVQEVAEFVATTGIGMPVLLGSELTAKDWEIRGFPTYFVIDANGNISSRSVGYSTAIGLRLRTWLAQFD
jgi:thiol-disulfide isomerase/thioredoxin